LLTRPGGAQEVLVLAVVELELALVGIVHGAGDDAGEVRVGGRDEQAFRDIPFR
jgi:hypothetical protein